MKSFCHFPIFRSLCILIACVAGGHHGLAEEPLLTPQPLPASVATAFENQQTSAHLLADPDYFVWGLTAMRWSDGKIHAYYARWPKRIGFSGWRTHSEIAHAVADSPAGPFRTTGVVVSSRNPQGWDSINAHNPSVCVADGKIYLYYVGNKIGDFYQPKDGNPLPDDAWLKDNLPSVHLSQLITVAVAEKPEGPFIRSPKPVFEPEGRLKNVAVNPAVLKHEGKFIMIAKGDDVRHQDPFRIQCIGISDRPDGPFQVLENPAFDEVQTEDACIWYDSRHKRIRSVVHVLFQPTLVEITSENGLDWEKAEPFVFTRKEFRLDDGTLWKPDRAERPFVLPDEQGNPEWLYIAVKQGERSGNVAVKLSAQP